MNKGGLKWTTVKLGFHFRSRANSPSIDANNTIYVAGCDPYRLIAIGPNGKLRWSFDTGDREMRGSPAIAMDGTVFQNAGDTLYAINPDGTQKWLFQAGDFIWSSPTIDPDGIVYFGSFDGSLYSIYRNGTLRWRFDKSGSIYSSPVLDWNRTVYFVGFDEVEKLFAVYPNGSLKWKVGFADDHLLDDIAIGDDGTIYCYDHRNALYAVNPDSTLRWSHPIPHGSPDGPGHMNLLVAIGNGGTIYSGSNDGLIALFPNGTEKWNFVTGSNAYSPIVSADETIFFTTGNSMLAIDSEGKQKWRFNEYIDEYDDIDGQPIIGRDGTLYFCTGSGLYAVNGEPRSFEILSIGVALLIILLITLIVGTVYLVWKRSRRRMDDLSGEERNPH